MNEETPSATIGAFLELREVALARGGRFEDAVAAWPSAARAALDNRNTEDLVPDEVFHDALLSTDDALEKGNGELVRAIGTARANAIVSPVAESFGHDPFRFLKEGGASLMYQGRANFGASSVEVTAKRAVVRLVAPEHVTRRTGEAPPRGPLLAVAFLERAIELVSGQVHVPRYTGHAPRVDARFDRPMVNLLYEFDLDEP